MNHISKERLARLRQYMSEQSYELFIIFTADAHLSEYISEAFKYREYFSGFTGSAGTLLVSYKEAWLWTDGRYFVQAEQELKGSDIILMKQGLDKVPNLIDFLREYCAGEEKIGFDGSFLSVKEFEKLQLLAKEKSLSLEFNASIPDYVWPQKPEINYKKVSDIDFKFSGMDTFEKINNVRKLIDKKYDGTLDYNYIISDLTSIMWLTNLRGDDISYVPVAFSYLIIRKCKAILFINRNCLNADIVNRLNEDEIDIIEYENFYDYIKNIKNNLIYIDKNRNNSKIFKLLDDNNDIVFADESLLIRKDIKNEVEIEHMRNNHIADAVSMIHFIYYLKNKAKENALPNEYEAGKLIDSLRLSNNECYELSFETISAYGKNAALPHYSAKEDDCDELKSVGFYLVDCGGQYRSCTTDITRTIALGKLSDFEKECYTAVLKGNLDLYSSVFLYGCRGENLDILARAPIWDIGLDYRHGTGHGIGCELSVHESPLSIRYRIIKDNIQPELEPGMVVSDEPGIYLENQFGIRLENELLVVEKNNNEWGRFLGFESLTLVPFEKEAIIIENLSPKQRFILNEYHMHVYDSLKSYFESDELAWFKEITSPI